MAEAHQQTSLDYSLPPSFITLLSKPLKQTLDALIPYTPAKVTKGRPAATDPFFSAMQTVGNALTWNGATAHADTKSPLVDLFYELTPGVDSKRLFELLDKAWKEDPLSTLRLVFHARSIHEGKGAEEESIRALAWVWTHHPRTFLANLHILVDPTCKRDRSKARDEAKGKRLAEKALKDGKVVALNEDGSMEVDEEEPMEYPARPHGTYKDLIDLLILHLHGQLSATYTGPLYAINESLAPASQKTAMKNRRTGPGGKRPHDAYKAIAKGIAKRHPEYVTPKKAKKNRQATQPAQPVPFELQLLHLDGKGRHALIHTRLNLALEQDKRFQALYLTVLDLFANGIRSDVDKLKLHHQFLALPEADRKPYKGTDSPHLFGMTYAAKWCPSPGKGADKQLHFVTALTHVLFPGRQDYFHGQSLQKEILTPVRLAQSVPESRMVKGEWKIDYSKVPSRSMRRNAQNFQLHDPVGFASYMRKVAAGKMTVSGASMFPHQLLQDAIHQTDPMLKQLADMQWKSLVDSLRSSPLRNCMAVADTSGSMGRIDGLYGRGDGKRPQPIEVCMALTLLLGELAAEPWSGGFFTFSSVPKFVTIDPTLPLVQKANTLDTAEWEMSTNIAALFDLILNTAQRNKLAPEQMIQKLFIFSDMQFDEAGGKQHGETEHQLFVRKFAEAGYTLPQIVYWNLAAQYDSSQPTSKPAQADTEGVELMSGYSGSLMKHFMGQDEESDDDVEEVKTEMDVKLQIGQAKKKTPMDMVNKVLRAESLAGVAILD